MKYHFILTIVFLVFFSGCIGDDIVLDTIDESIKITNSIDSLEVGMSYQFEVRFLNNVGQMENRPVTWTSSDSEVLTIDENGLATGIAAGIVDIISTIDLVEKEPISDIVSVTVTEEEVIIVEPEPASERTGTLQTTSSYIFEGGFVLKKTEDELRLELLDDFSASSSLPGLYLYLTNNPTTNNNALEISEITQFSGAQSFVLPEGVGLNDYQYVLGYCKPFSVKVGDGEFEN